jgi:simple sugar transport system ATP-binding protein
MLIGDHFVVLNQGATSAIFNRGEKSREDVLNLMAGGDPTGDGDADLAFVEEIETSLAKGNRGDQP